MEKSMQTPIRGPQGESGVSSHSQQHVLLVLLEDSPDVLEDFWRKQIDATVDDVTHECAGFLHIVHHLQSREHLHKY